MMSYFLDKDGVFMWSSIAAIVSGIVLIFQTAQFIYQKNQIKKLKKLDVMIEFRISDLKELKKFIIGLDDYLSSELIRKTGEPLSVKESLQMSINPRNPRQKELQNVIIKYTHLLINRESTDPEELVMQLTKTSDMLYEEYKLYEEEEIKMIEKYI